MEKYSAFVGRHWLLVATFAILIIALFFLERRSTIKGAKSISPAQLVDKVNHQKAILVDLRDHALFNQAHIAGALSLPCTNLELVVKKLKLHKGRSIILYGASSRELAKIVACLRQEGISDLYILINGISAWQQAGLPLVTS